MEDPDNVQEEIITFRTLRGRVISMTAQEYERLQSRIEPCQKHLYLTEPPFPPLESAPPRSDDHGKA